MEAPAQGEAVALDHAPDAPAGSETEQKPETNEREPTRNDEIRMWKERSARMEALLAKKNAKIQEMEETESKLKRLLAMAKRSIDNSKQEIAEKDAEMDQLREEVAKRSQSSHSWLPDESTRDPRRILYKILHANSLWCFVEYADEDNDVEEASSFAWHQFHNEDELKAYTNRASGEPIVLPGLSLTPYEAERVRKDLKDEIDRVQEEFRRYRVRAEITRKQKDAEIRKMSANAISRQTEQIAETDLAADLQATKAQLRRLGKAQTETEERESEWRRKFEKLMKDYEKLSGTMGETVLATEWRERYEQSVREREEMEKKMDELKLMVSSSDNGNSKMGVGSSDLQSLRNEFAQYRKRALNAVEQKEKELTEMQAHMHENNGTSSQTASAKEGPGSRNGFNSVPLRRMSSGSSSSLSGFEAPHSTTTNEYLKNIVYKYMISDQDEAKEHMEKAIVTVLNFTPTEVAVIQRRIMADQKNVVNDQRFQKVHNDPRFARNSKRKNKLQVDQRFAGVLNDDKFQSVRGKYDKYGRRIEQKQNELKKFYRLEDEDDNEKQENDVSDDDEDEEATAKPKKTESDDDEDEDSTTASSEGGHAASKNDEKLSRLEYLNQMARGELESGSSSSSDSDSDSDADDDVEESEEEKEDIPLGEQTKRFAVLNCDWTRIRAVDIFALCQSFAPATGAVQNVTIYPSDYGLAKMKEEEKLGPQGLWREKPTKTEAAKGDDAEAESNDGEQKSDEEKEEDATMEAEGDDSENEDEDEEVKDDYDSDDPLGVKKRVTEEDDNGFDQEKLRAYELQKLKYYYAIVTCDSVKTASAVFDNCDQLEYETSSNLLDLRFVPDDVEFTNSPKDTCETVPDHYKPTIFSTTALQNTDVKLTWEGDDDNRLELLTRQAEWKNVDDNDFSAYLASECSSSEAEDDSDDGSDAEVAVSAQSDKKKEAKLKKLKNRYRKALLGSDAEDSDDDSGDAAGGASSGSDDDDEEGNMEMSFTPGASDILKAKKQKELEAEETPFERYTREKKQQKNQKLHEKRTKQKQLAREQQEVLKKRGKGAPNQVKMLREAINDKDSDDDGDQEGGNDIAERNFDMKTIALQEKVKKLKGKRKSKEMKKLAAKSGAQEGFEFNAADPRFGALYAHGAAFQLDPTDPKFKQTEATKAIFQERRNRNERMGNKGTTAAQPATASTEASAVPTNAIKSMVENLKRKSQPQTKKPVKKHKF